MFPPPSPMNTRTRPGRREREEATVNTSNPAKKRKGNPKLAEQARERAAYARAMKAKMEEYGASTPEELFAKMAVAPPSDGAADRLVERIETAQPSKDCLHYITPDVPYVGIVSTYSTITLRPGRERMNPPMHRVVMNATGREAWGFCPFHIGDNTSEENDQRMKLMKARWHVHTLSREMAEMVWDDPRFPKPVRTVIDPKTFKGYDTNARAARGDLVEITDFDALREVTRICLMRLSETFLDYGRRPAGFDFDPRIVNPYKNKIPGLRMKTQAPKATEADYTYQDPRGDD